MGDAYKCCGRMFAEMAIDAVVKAGAQVFPCSWPSKAVGDSEMQRRASRGRSDGDFGHLNSAARQDSCAMEGSTPVLSPN